MRLAASLRRNGGSFARSPMYAVTARIGPPLARATLRRLEELEVEHVRVPGDRRYGWYHFLNKPLAVAGLESRVDTELVAFLDSDTLVLGEPTALALPPEVSLAACVTDMATGETLGGTTGPDSPNEPLWDAMCRLVGIDVDALPWVTTHLAKERVRLYFNSGVFVYRRDSSLGRRYLDLTVHSMDAHLGLLSNGEHLIEQFSLPIASTALGLPWEELPYAYNYTMASYFPHFDPDEFARARVVHYHDAMDPPTWPLFLDRLRGSHPEAAGWVESLGPLRSPAPAPARALGEALRVGRGVRRRLYRRRVSAPASG